MNTSVKQVIFGLIATIISGTVMLFVERCFFSRTNCPISSMNISSENLQSAPTNRIPGVNLPPPIQKNETIPQTVTDTNANKSNESVENADYGTSVDSLKVVICHDGKETLYVTQSESSTHLAHGDVSEACAVTKEKKGKRDKKQADQQEKDKKGKEKDKSKKDRKNKKAKEESNDTAQ